MELVSSVGSGIVWGFSELGNTCFANKKICAVITLVIIVLILKFGVKAFFTNTKKTRFANVIPDDKNKK